MSQMNGLHFFQSPDLNHWIVTKRLWLWSLVNHVTCKVLLSISFPFSFKMPVYTCAIKPSNIYVSAPWIWPRCKRQKKNISPQNNPSAGGWFWSFGRPRQSSCVPDLAIPSQSFFVFNPRWNAQRHASATLWRGFPSNGSWIFHPARINQTSREIRYPPQGYPGDLMPEISKGN